MFARMVFLMLALTFHLAETESEGEECILPYKIQDVSPNQLVPVLCMSNNGKCGITIRFYMVSILT